MSSTPVALPRATLTLLAGALLAQALPLALGPWLARLYSPEDYGRYTTFAALAANLAVVACARYEYALPMARDEAEAEALLALAWRVLIGVAALAGLAGALAGLSGWLPHAGLLAAAVAAAGAAQLGTMWATRRQRFLPLAVSRVVQHGGGALLQLGLGLAWVGGIGSIGLVAGPVLGALAGALLLALWGGGIAWRRVAAVDRERLREVAHRHREFPLLNTPHAFLGALQDTVTVVLIGAWAGDPAVGLWGLSLRYLKAPASLIGGAVSQALYPRLTGARSGAEARQAVRQVIAVLAAIGATLALLLMLAGPALFAWAFGERWREAGELARALGPYIGFHFVCSPLAVVTMAWQAQGWALRLALFGQLLFVLSLGLGLWLGGLRGAGWCLSLTMSGYFAYYLHTLCTWSDPPVVAASPAATVPA
ncbi:lipopolysaccharide biosynthesis protein [Leptothrix discophora]|uniref:Oligosaccharide flippase family protein n=1 Tax=Leptothrix discophora TaxID=89 RepID=A0ABT9G7X2_LEPDI|nr:oligosaccharide flippase family protein [Leptothrix discophora]MDP4302579.1 oligosaccharide flippase family protein [Leptothrix discophora]